MRPLTGVSTRPEGPGMTKTIEQCWVLTASQEGNDWQVRLGCFSSGQAHQVEADWLWALAREENHGDVAGFLHTHPPNSGTSPSQRDRQTMEAWCRSFGKPLLCLIQAGRSLSAWQFQSGLADPQPMQIRRIGNDEFQVTNQEPESETHE